MYLLAFTDDADAATHARLHDALVAFVAKGTVVGEMHAVQRERALALEPAPGDHRVGHGHGWVLWRAPEPIDAPEADVLAALQGAQSVH